MSSVLQRWIPATRWGRRYRREDLGPDMVAGLTVGAMLVPQGMAYAQLAGLPPEIGLYSVTLPLLVYAIFGTSRQLAVGPVAVVSLVTASALAPIAEQGTQAYLVGAAVLALLVGVINVVLGVVRMGWVTNLMSHPVLVGYTAAAAIIIGTSQVKHLLGVKIPRRDEWIGTIEELVRALDTTRALTLAIGIAALVTLTLLKRWRKTFPGALAVVLAGVGASALFGLSDRNVSVVGEIPGGLPGLGFPDLGNGLVADLLPAALVITVVGYAESIAVAKVYARRARYDIDPNQELVALGASNLAAGVIGGQPVTGGFSRTAVNATAGARTPLSSIVSAAVITVVLLVATGLFTELPQAILGAIVISAVASLVDVAEMRHIASVKRSDTLTMAVSFVATLALGVELGLGVAVLASLAVVVTRLMNPHTAELGRLPGTETYRNLARFPEAESVAGIAVLRIDVSLNFANATFLKERLRRLETSHPEGLRAIVLDGAGINDLDASAEATLADLLTDYEERQIALHLANMKGPVRDVMLRSGLWSRLGPHRVHPSVHAAITAIEHPDTPGPPDARALGVDERT